MLLYDYQYDLAAILINIVLLAIFFLRRSYITKTNKIFIMIVCCNFFAAFFDAISCYTISFPEKVPILLNSLICAFYLFFFNMTNTLYFAYIDSRAKLPYLKKISKYVIISITLFYFFITISSPWTHLLAYFDENLNYCHGPFMAIVYIIPIFTVSAEIYMFIVARDRFDKYQVVANITFIVFMFVGVLIQLLFPRYLVGPLFCSIVLFFIYMVYENPAYYTYLDSSCLNRRAFNYTIKHNVTRQQTTHITIFSILDYEYIRHTFGRSFASKLTMQISKILYDHFTSRAYCLSEDRFAIISSERMMAASSKNWITDFFSKSILVMDIPFSVHYEIGVLFDLDSKFSPEDIEEIIDTKINISSIEMNDDIIFSLLEEKHRKEKMLHVLQRATANDEFMVYYQPIYDLSTNKFLSAEALIRLNDEELGFLNPEEMITMAEENGLINQIGEQVFRKVCRFIHEGGLNKLNIDYIEINLSPIQCMQINLVDIFYSIMKEYEIDPRWINLEITETSQVSRFDIVYNNIIKLSELGIQFSIDDYGSGFASADYLIKLPVSIVKIDKTILWNAMKKKQAMIVLSNTMKMLHELGKHIVVEGAETKEMIDILFDHKCDYIQGYYYSKPLPEDQYLDFIKKNNM